MGQDIRKLFKETLDVGSKKIPKGHKSRFEVKLEKELPIPMTIGKKSSFAIMKIAASIALVVSLSLSGYFYLSVEDSSTPINSMADISPDLKKVEDYYLTHINYQFSKIKITKENRAFLETYFSELGILQEAYKSTIAKIDSEAEVSEETIDGLIENLQSRLKLMFQLKAQLKKMNSLNKQENENIKA
jgi:hypothetical protein